MVKKSASGWQCYIQRWRVQRPRARPLPGLQRFSTSAFSSAVACVAVVAGSQLS
jgi:hypothetical protein